MVPSWSLLLVGSVEDGSSELEWSKCGPAGDGARCNRTTLDTSSTMAGFSLETKRQTFKPLAQAETGTGQNVLYKN